MLDASEELEVADPVEALLIGLMEVEVKCRVRVRKMEVLKSFAGVVVVDLFLSEESEIDDLSLLGVDGIAEPEVTLLGGLSFLEVLEVEELSVSKVLDADVLSLSGVLNVDTLSSLFEDDLGVDNVFVRLRSLPGSVEIGVSEKLSVLSLSMVEVLSLSGMLIMLLEDECWSSPGTVPTPKGKNVGSSDIVLLSLSLPSVRTANQPLYAVR